ncbi:uncharacterized protein [Penaeus vannamei]|uniref:uncharacterized protein n=1 Tax=Penaeus vannamei TaxID=6689 RepID=UPI00387F89AD
MTTVTVGLVGGAGVAAAAAVAGAVGLGLLALAGIGRRSSRRSSRRSYRHKNSHRYGREAPAAEKQEQAAALENLLEDVRLQDETGCGRRLLCELAKEDEQELSQEEFDILSMVGPDVKPGEGLLPPFSATGEYARARAFGRKGGDCDAAFPLCPFNGSQLMDNVMAYLP